MMNKKNLIALMLAATAAVGLAASASAGVNDNTNVYVYKASNGSGRASGALNQARNSSDSKQHIYCHTDSNRYVSCYARNSSGTSISCFSYKGSEDAFARVVTGINRASMVSFSVDSSGECTYVQIYNESSNL